MNKLKMFAPIAILMGLSSVANADSSLLAYDDFVGMTFWLISMGMLAATVFFFIERGSVATGWKTPVTLAGLITGIAFINYMYVRGVWVHTGELQIIYRYIEWLITMPLQMIMFYLILAAVRKVSSGMFWRLLIGSLVMLIGGYLGEAAHIHSMVGIAIWMVGWIYILYEIFSGETGKVATRSGNKAFVTAFGALRMIVTIGWCIYPLGYVFGPALTDSVDSNSLNVIYNLADFINKIVFGLIIWAAAISSGGRTR